MPGENTPLKIRKTDNIIRGKSDKLVNMRKDMQFKTPSF
jgi:hypothetical protein